MCANIEFKATTRKQHRGDFTSLRMVLPKIAKWRRISVRGGKVGFVAFQKTKCVCRFYIKLKLYCNSLTTDLQDYQFHGCYMCANIAVKATTRKQHKGDFTSLRMVLPKIAEWRRISVRAGKAGFVAFQKRSVYVDFTLN